MSCFLETPNRMYAIPGEGTGCTNQKLVFARKLHYFMQIASLSYTCKQFLATFTFCQLPASANQIAYYNRSAFLFLGKTLLVEGCELSTTSPFASCKLFYYGLHKEDGTNRLAISFLIAKNPIVGFFQGDGKCAMFGALATRSASLGARRTSL